MFVENLGRRGGGGGGGSSELLVGQQLAVVEMGVLR